MKQLIFGSLNIDKVYQVGHIVRPAETILAAGCEEFCGGKGFNQGIALARAASPGLPVPWAPTAPCSPTS